MAYFYWKKDRRNQNTTHLKKEARIATYQIYEIHVKTGILSLRSHRIQ